jgi:uncharacterized protein involved in tolerance to divalent cations
VKSSLVELVVACKSWQEAQNIADALLEGKLAKTVEIVETASKHHLKYSFGQARGLKLIIQTTEAKVPRVRQVVGAQRHGEYQPPYHLASKKLKHEVTKWLRKATEVKSVKLK